ncbi:MAG: porin [Alphaproteobacteria bacterium]|nr:porin [Alphaproteobacteria bacterium]
MRKILLATTALVAISGAAYAAPASKMSDHRATKQSPIQVTLGGYADFRAALFHESQKSADALGLGKRRYSDLQTEYGVIIAAEGKAAQGVTYGGVIGINNDQKYDQQVALDEAYVWGASAMGEIVLGDARGPADMFVYAPTVGEGQIAGKYTNFTDPQSFGRFHPTFIDPTDTSTKAAYYTPKFELGSAQSTLRAGVSFAPSKQKKGTEAYLYEPLVGAPAENVVEVAAEYKGTFDRFGLKFTPMMVMTQSKGDHVTSERSAFIWGLGGQVSFDTLTLGASYVDGGHYGAWSGDTNRQYVWTIGAGYDYNEQIELAVNYMQGKGYVNRGYVSGVTGFYVNRFAALGAGASYQWFPGFATAADAVFFNQKSPTVPKNIGRVLMLSQKIAF